LHHRAPDDVTYEVTAPAGATEAQVLEYAKRHIGADATVVERWQCYGKADVIFVGAIALGPPAVLFALGLVGVWIARGFRS
jgi:hypothetical protein